MKKCGQLFEEQVISDSSCCSQLKTAKDIMKVMFYESVCVCVRVCVLGDALSCDADGLH